MKERMYLRVFGNEIKLPSDIGIHIGKVDNSNIYYIRRDSSEIYRHIYNYKYCIMIISDKSYTVETSERRLFTSATLKRYMTELSKTQNIDAFLTKSFKDSDEIIDYIQSSVLDYKLTLPRIFSSYPTQEYPTMGRYILRMLLDSGDYTEETAMEVIYKLNSYLPGLLPCSYKCMTILHNKPTRVFLNNLDGDMEVVLWRQKTKFILEIGSKVSPTRLKIGLDLKSLEIFEVELNLKTISQNILISDINIELCLSEQEPYFDIKIIFTDGSTRNYYSKYKKDCSLLSNIISISNISDGNILLLVEDLKTLEKINKIDSSWIKIE